MKPTIGVVGLGIMGGAMAEALLADGFEVIGYDVLTASRVRLKQAGGQPLPSSTAVAKGAEVLITSLATVAALDDAIERIAAAKRPKIRPGLIVIETSTLPIADKERAMHRLRRAGITLLDCPISGTAVRLKQGAWTIFASGSSAAYRRVQAILNVFTRNAPYVGAFGNGTRMKFIANHMVAIQNVAVGESITFARKMGLDPQQVWDLFAASPIIGSGVYKLRGKFMVDRKYLPATMKIEVWQKDMQVIGDMAKAVNCPTPLFSACVPLFNAAMAQGLSQHDTASVCEVLDSMAGGTRKRAKR
jgi:3-hydroxyisobutyrate dehydrogenase-like beta-hydroxyacid dehydrogenase